MVETPLAEAPVLPVALEIAPFEIAAVLNLDKAGGALGVGRRRRGSLADEQAANGGDCDCGELGVCECSKDN